MKNVIKPLAKSVLIPFWLNAAESAADAGIHKKISGSGHRHFFTSTLNNDTILIISNDKMQDIVKIVKDSGLLLKGSSKTIRNEAREKRERFPSMLLGALGRNLLGDILTGKWINRPGEGHSQGIARAGYEPNSRSKKQKFFFQYIHRRILILKGIFLFLYIFCMCGCFCIGFIDY